MSRRLVSLLFALAFATGCDSGDAGQSTPTVVPPQASSAPAPPPPPPTPGGPVTFSSEDGAALSGVLYVAPDHGAPTVVVVHRLYGDRQELSPLVERLREAKKRYSIIAFDLAGHGNSKLPEKSKPDDVDRLTKDVRAAIRRAEEATEKSTRGFVLVGSSLGATLVSRVAFDEPKVLALALVSPGAAISGMGIYEPFAEVRTLPTFLAGSADDPVSREPLDALGKMAKNGTVKRYPGVLHSAGHIAKEHPELWDDLTKWLMSVFDAKAQPRGPRQYPHAGKKVGAR